MTKKPRNIRVGFGGRIGGEFNIMFMVSKTSMAIFKKDTFSRILSNFRVNFCANPPVRVKFWKKSSNAKILDVLVWKGVFWKTVVMHAYAYSFKFDCLPLPHGFYHDLALKSDQLQEELGANRHCPPPRGSALDPCNGYYLLDLQVQFPLKQFTIYPLARSLE